MNDKLTELLGKLKELESEIVIELQKKEKDFFYQIEEKKVRFEKEVRVQHRILIQHIPQYLRDASLMNIVTSPVIYALIIPALLLDLFITVFQTVCFPVYGIPKVERSKHIVMDRQFLQYLNMIERLNCYYCGYFNGLISYVGEIAARTEQYWCPIKHARRIKSLHSRYKYFLEYGDAEGYRKNLETLRGDFSDLERKHHNSAPAQKADET